MTPTEILTPIIIGLAFYGFVQCLAQRLWLTLLFTVALGWLVVWTNPFEPEHALAWLGAVLGVFVAVIAARLTLSESSTAHIRPKKRSAPSRQKTTQKTQKKIVIDGTNVLFWDDNEASLATLRGVVDDLKSRAFSPHVFLDASSKHHLDDDSLSPKKFARSLGLNAGHLTVCPAGTEADAFILKYAKSNSLPIVSNDRFGDRAQQVKGMKLVKGIFANGKPIFEGL